MFLSLLQLNLTTGSVTLPTILVQPVSVSVAVGQSAVFVVAANNATGYQWYKNGSAILGATNPNYVTPSLALGDNGSSYSVVVSNAFGSVTSSTATVTVTSTATSASPLVTSGTFGVTAFDNRTIIDRAYGAIGVRPQQITPEMLQIALDLLALILTDLVNDAAPLWTIEKRLITLIQGQSSYVLPTATNDLTSAFFRTMSDITPLIAVSSSSSYELQFSSASPVGTIGITWTGTAVPVTFQTSPDGITWTSVGSSTVTDTGTIFYDVDNSAAALYWRVIPTQGLASAISISSVRLYNTPNDIPMYRMNRDQYWSMPNKIFQGRPLQFYLDRQIRPTMMLWPAPDAISVQGVMVVYRQRYIMDVGSLQQTMELPTRWYFAIMNLLAQALAPTTPEADPSRIALVNSIAPVMLQRAWREERDRSPIEYQVNLAPYTR